MGWFKKKTKPPEKVGGIAFFLSLFFLSVLTLSNYILLPALWGENSWDRFKLFLPAAVIGGWAANFLIRGHLSVLIHEFKHSLLSGLVGNRAKGLSVKRNSGHFEFEYTKDTAEYNAFISLAPYFIPLFTVPAGIFSWAALSENPDMASGLLGAALAIDLVLNFRDAHPYQTDFSNLRGGFGVGLYYVIVANLFTLSVVLSWVFDGVTGPKFLLYGIWQITLHIVSFYRERGSP